MDRKLHILTFGRCSLDLLSDEIGADFNEIEAFSTNVGGSAVNIAIGASRLGLTSGVLTAVGNDPTGQLATALIEQEGVQTDHLLRKSGQTNVAFVGAELDKPFEFMLYDATAPEQQIAESDLDDVPFADVQYFVIAGANLAKRPLRAVTLAAAQKAVNAGAKVVLDLDATPTIWEDVDEYQATVGEILPHCHLLFGSPRAFCCLVGEEAEHVWQLSEMPQKYAEALNEAMANGVGENQCWIVKRNLLGAAAFQQGAPPLYVLGYRTDVFNQMGRDDAFISSTLFGLLEGKEWFPALRYANAVSSMVGQAYEISRAMPTKEEADSFIANFGVFELPPD